MKSSASEPGLMLNIEVEGQLSGMKTLRGKNDVLTSINNLRDLDTNGQARNRVNRR